MKKKLSMVIALVFIFCSCHDDKERVGFYRGPRILEATGYAVPEDSMAMPEVIPVDENKLKRVRAGKPTIVFVNTNIHPAGAPRVTAGITVPGAGQFSSPKTTLAISHPTLARNPEIVQAKDMASKDHNPASFSYFGRLQGLKDNLVTSILEDKIGNLWFATNSGVSKYDGKFFTHYTEKQGLLNDIIWSMLEDKDGNFWFGTNGGGVSRYDGKFFTHYTEKEGLSNNSVSSILEDKSGNLWFGTYGGGVNKYDGKSFTHYTDKEGLSSNFIFSILEDKSGNLWFGTNGGGVSKFDGKSFTHYTDKEGLSNNFVFSILEDKNGNLWFGTNGGGVCKYDGNSFSNYTVKEGLSDNRISSMLEEKSGDLWFGTIGGGVNKFDGKFFEHYSEKEGLPNNHVSHLFEDKRGNLWIGSRGGGVSKYDGKSFTHYIEKEGLSSSPVFSILKDKNGNLWFGKNGGGASKYDGKFFVQYTQKQGLPSDNVTCMLEDKSGNLWFGTGVGGVSRYDGKHFTNFTVKEGLSSNSVWCISEDKNGNLWFGTWGSGVSKYDGKSFTRYSEKEGLSNNIVLSILEDKKGNIWLGTRGGGVCKYNGKSFTRFAQKEGMPNNNVGSIFEDKSGILWFGTWGGGISKFDGKFFTHYTEKEGLSSNDVIGILEDKSGNVWFSTTKGISCLTLRKRTVLSGKVNSDTFGESDIYFKNFTYADGFLGIAVNIGKTMLEDQHGDIWIGANDRLTVMHPSGLTRDSGEANIQMNNIELFNENINWTSLSNRKDTSFILASGIRIRHLEFDGLKRWYNVPEHLSLNYDNNYLAFHYIGITTHRPQQVKYQYKLEGLDKNWSSLTSRTEAAYGNLPHGSYTFKAKAVNSEGFWSKEINYSFIIRPPWWQTWWAYVIYGLMFTAAMYIAHYLQKQRVIRTERERTRKRELAQAKEIEKAYQELKTTQAQLIQSEKMASLGELTAGIAHEIQNPLNFVNNFSEVNKELIEDAESEIDKGNFNEIRAILSDLKENQEKINQHGKRADSIVKGMLQHSRTSSGQKELTDINALADEYLRLSYHGMRAKDKTFNATLQTDFDTSIEKIGIIPQDVGRVLLNLFNNAFYAVHEKQKEKGFGYEPTVSISTKRVNDKVEISVTDNGNGIPSKVVDKIFQPFFTTKPTGQGTGLGLSMSYDIVKAHGGELKMETKEGEGSNFILQLLVV